MTQWRTSGKPGKRLIDREIKFLTPEERTLLFNIIAQDKSLHAQRNKAIFFVAKYCALRASEIGLIQLHDYNAISHSIYCRRVKGSNSNTIKIVDPIVAGYLDVYYHFRVNMLTDSKYLFLSQKGSPVNRRTLDNLMKFYGEKAGLNISKCHFHVLKHTRAMELINYPRVELRDVQWWLGHKSINNTMLYLKYTSKAQEKLFGYIAEVEGGNLCQRSYQECM